MNSLLPALILSFLTGPLWAQKLIILHTNDHHGQFMANSEGKYGLAAQSTIIKKIREEARKEGATVLVLSAGDINTGAPESNLFRAKPDIEAMNVIGYDAMVVGNHEFDFPPEVLREQQKTAKFEYLGANIKGPKGESAFTPYITKEAGGKKIAIVGFTTSETPGMTAEINRGSLLWESPFPGQRPLVKELRQNHDMVIALSHMGYYPNEADGLPFPGDESLAKKIPEIDLIVGGHTHTALHEPVTIGKTSIVQAKEGGQFVGRVEVDLSGERPRITSYTLIPVAGVPEDPEVLKVISPYLNASREKFQKKVGFAHEELKGGREAVNLADSPLGNFVAEAKKDMTGADVAIVNGRGLRAGIPKGDVTYRDLLSVSPFGNTVTTVELNGQELWKMVEIAHEKYLTKRMENAYFSKNFEIVIVDNKVNKILINGTEIPNSPQGKYKVATGNYISEMVTEFSFMKQNPTFRNTGVSEVEAMERFLKKNSQIHPEKLLHKTLRAPIPNGCSQALLNLLRELQKSK